MNSQHQSVTQASLSIDPREIEIQEEVEEFLRELTLEYPFPEVFESLRRYEYRDRYGTKVLPFPKKIEVNKSIRVKDIEGKIRGFLRELKGSFGDRYTTFIDDSFRFYTQTTVD